MADPEEPSAAPSSERGRDEQRAELVRRIMLGELTAEEACERAHLTHAELKEWVKLYRRAVRRAVDDQFATALAAQGIDVDDFVLSGNLESLSLADLFETIHQGRKDAHILIEQRGEPAHIWCIDGEVVDARAGELVGKPAVHRLLSLTSGRLQVDFSKVERERTLIAPIPTLLSTAARRREEASALRAQIGVNTVYSAQPRPGEPPPEPPERRRVLELFDDEASAGEVIARSVLPDLETLQAIAGLIAEGWLTAKVQVPHASMLAEGAPFAQASFRPVSASLWSAAATPPAAGRLRRVAAVSVVLAIPLAFGLGIWSARPAAPPEAVSATAARTMDDTLGATLCGPDMAFVPAGLPLEPFCLAKREVSTAEYQACVGAGQCEAALTDVGAAVTPGSPAGTGCNAGRADRAHHPINCVTARQAEQYCSYRDARLPLESEWDFAARVSSSTLEGLTGRGGDVSEWTRGEVLSKEPGRDGAPAAVRHVVLEGPKQDGVGRAEGVPTRVYMSASAQARGVGFRCALSLQTSAAPPGAAPPNRDE